MYANYSFELVKGEDRSIPISFFYKYPQSRRHETVKLAGLDFVCVVRDWITKKELARLSTDDQSIVLGNLDDLEFIQAESEEEETTAMLLIFSHDITEKFDCRKAVFELFAVSRSEQSETRQCLMIGEIKMMQGCSYG